MNKEEFYDKIIKLAQTSTPQFKLVMDYGLRQIKYMFDADKILEMELPENSVIVGLSVMGQFNAIDYENKIVRYVGSVGSQKRIEESVVFDPDVERVFRQADQDTQNKLRISDELKRNENLVSHKNDLLKENETLASTLQSNQTRLNYIENLNFFQRLLFLFFKSKILKRFGEIK